MQRIAQSSTSKGTLARRRRSNKAHEHFCFKCCCFCLYVFQCHQQVPLMNVSTADQVYEDQPSLLGRYKQPTERSSQSPQACSMQVISSGDRPLFFLLEWHAKRGMSTLSGLARYRYKYWLSTHASRILNTTSLHGGSECCQSTMVNTHGQYRASCPSTSPAQVPTEPASTARSMYSGSNHVTANCQQARHSRAARATAKAMHSQSGKPSRMFLESVECRQRLTLYLINP